MNPILAMGWFGRFLDGSYWLILIAFFAVPVWLVFLPPQVARRRWWLRPISAVVVFSACHYSYYHGILIPACKFYSGQNGGLVIIEPSVECIDPLNTIGPSAVYSLCVFAVWLLTKAMKRMVKWHRSRIRRFHN